MSTVLDQMRLRHADRREIILDSRKLKPPIITDAESVKEHQALIKKLQSNLVDKCFWVERDVQILLTVGEQYIEGFDEKIKEAWEKLPIAADEQEIAHEREQAQREAEAKAASDAGECEGQMKIPGTGKGGKVKDDGSVAEAASDVTTTKLEETTVS